VLFLHSFSNFVWFFRAGKQLFGIAKHSFKKRKTFILRYAIILTTFFFIFTENIPKRLLSITASIQQMTRPPILHLRILCLTALAEIFWTMLSKDTMLVYLLMDKQVNILLYVLLICSTFTSQKILCLLFHLENPLMILGTCR
jgi:hypothetical protein